TSLSTPVRLRSSRRSSCVWTPSSVAWVGCVSCRYPSRSSTKCGSGSETFMGLACARVVPDELESGPIRQWYNKDARLMSGTLFVVATPIGNLEDISARALRVLGEVTLIAAEDTRRTGHLLARFGITTPTTSLHEHNERAKSRTLVARLCRGDNIALV